MAHHAGALLAGAHAGGGRPAPARPAPSPAPSPSLPRVHAPPRRPPLVEPPPEPPEVSLATPRPDGERRVNEYVETPLRDGRPPRARTCRDLMGTGTATTARPREPHRQSVTLPVRQQPTTFKKEPALGLGGHPAPPGLAAPLPLPLPHQTPPLAAPLPPPSIICPSCGHCRCEACREPRALPSRWLCGDACFCSAETSLDYATCLCCVKGLFYHCGGEDGAEDPCSCAPGVGVPPGLRCARWSCLALASLALPCLWCYWPLRGLVRACELCYARYCDHGCRCDRRVSGGRVSTGRSERRPVGRPGRPGPALLTPEKRLLDTD